MMWQCLVFGIFGFLFAQTYPPSTMNLVGPPATAALAALLTLGVIRVRIAILLREVGATLDEREIR
jgi:hypothetical protein